MSSLPLLVLNHPWLFGLIVFLSVLLLFQLGRWLGRRVAGEAGEGLGLMDGAIFGLLGLLMAFTFSGAASRFEERRMQIVEEANAIGTARLRLDLLEPAARDEARALFDRYVESRLETYRRLPDLGQVRRQHEETQRIQEEIWRLAVEAGRQPGALPAINISLLPALNAMFDMASSRIAVAVMHTPPIVYLVLWTAAMLASLIAGHATAGVKRAHGLHLLAFGIMMAVALFVSVDFDYPRAGLIRETGFDSLLAGEAFPSGSVPGTR
ncbi:bestrophin-like domain [Thermaurantiacus sp.]